MKTTTQPSRAGILKATVVALAIAAVLLVTAILPAEYGINPLGTGHALGLTALSGTTEPIAGASSLASSPVPGAESRSFHQDEYRIELRPFEGVEYKYRLEQGDSLVYAWASTASVEFEFHGEPDGAPAKYFDSYAKGDASQAQGGFTAAKPGIHGWYWKNNGATRLTVTLHTAGFYSKSTEFRDGEKIERRFPAANR